MTGPDTWQILYSTGPVRFSELQLLVLFAGNAFPFFFVALNRKFFFFLKISNCLINWKAQFFSRWARSLEIHSPVIFLFWFPAGKATKNAKVLSVFFSPTFVEKALPIFILFYFFSVSHNVICKKAIYEFLFLFLQFLDIHIHQKICRKFIR